MTDWEKVINKSCNVLDKTVGIILTLAPIYWCIRMGVFGKNYLSVVNSQEQTPYYINSNSIYTTMEYTTVNGKTKSYWFIRPVDVIENVDKTVYFGI